MIVPARNICLFILLGVLAGNILITAHTATHTAGDIGECELCIGSGDAADALEAADDYDIVDGDSQYLAGFQSQAGERPRSLPFRPRDPPGFS